MPEPTIPKYLSRIENVDIDIETFPKNLAGESPSGHVLEDWFWMATIKNEGNPFIRVGEGEFWIVYIVRSKVDRLLKFNQHDGDNSEILQLFPGQEPKLITVEDVVLEIGEAGMAMSMILSDLLEGSLKRDIGLYQYGT